MEESLKEMRDCIEHSQLTLAAIENSRSDCDQLNPKDLAVVKTPKRRLSLQELLTNAKECLRTAKNDGDNEDKSTGQ